jgi:hypothetical protein
MHVFRFQRNPVSGFPLRASIAVYLAATPPRAKEPTGPPGFSDTSLPVCLGLWTSAGLHTLAPPAAFPSVYVNTLGIRNKLISNLYQHFRGAPPTTKLS